MAGIAIVRGIGVITRFALRDAAIMTTDTAAYDLAMVQWGNKLCPVGGGYPMTGFTKVGRGGMVARLTLCDTPIMTTDAGTDDLIMIQWRDE